MAIFIQVNDVHTSDKAPHWRTDSYNDDIFAKLYQIVDLANVYGKEDHVTIVFTGDLFHQPQPSRVSHALVNQWLSYLDVVDRQTMAEVVIIPGNHDMLSNDSLARQPIMALDAVPCVTVITDPQLLHTYDDNTSFACIPWSHRATTESTAKILAEFNYPDITFIHAPIAKVSSAYFATIDAGALDGLTGVLGYGHLHAPEEPYNAGVGITLFVNPGALSRGSLTPSDLGRTPQVAVINTERPSTTPTMVQYVPLVCKPAEHIYRLEEKVKQDSESKAIDKFVQSLGEANIGYVTPESIKQEIRLSLAYDIYLASMAEDILNEVA